MRGNRPAAAALLAWALALAGTLRAAGPAVEETGLRSTVALRQNAVALAKPRLEGPGLPVKGTWVSTTHVRPTLSFVKERWSLESAVEARLGWNSAGLKGASSSPSAGSPYSRPAPFERLDMTLDPVRRGGTELRLRVERLKAAVSLGELDVEAGRQPVGLGTSKFAGVLDVLSPFPPGDLDATYKPGIDALRLRVPAGPEGEAELIAAAADPWPESALIVRLRRRLGSMDGELMTGRFRRRLFAGAAWEGDLGPLAVWGEAALFQRRLEKETLRNGSREGAFAGVAGVQWRPRENTLLGAALYRSDFGARRARDLALVAADAPFKEGWAFLAGREHASLTAHWEPHSLVSLDASAILSLTDGSSLWQPRVTVNAHDDADVSLYAWLARGRRPDGMLPRSEFGSMADGLGLYCRFFF